VGARRRIKKNNLSIGSKFGVGHSQRMKRERPKLLQALALKSLQKAQRTRDVKTIPGGMGKFLVHRIEEDRYLGAADKVIALERAAVRGNVRGLRALLRWGVGVNVRNGMALKRAASYGHADCVKELLEWGADANIDGGRPLYCAVVHNKADVVRILVEAGVDVSGTEFDLLETAVKYNYTEVVRVLLDSYEGIYLTEMLQAYDFARDPEIEWMMFTHGMTAEEVEEERQLRIDNHIELDGPYP